MGITRDDMVDRILDEWGSSGPGRARDRAYLESLSPAGLQRFYSEVVGSTLRPRAMPRMPEDSGEPIRRADQLRVLSSLYQRLVGRPPGRRKRTDWERLPSNRRLDLID